MNSKVPVRLAVLAVVSCVAPLPVFAGDKAMPTDVAQSTGNKAVQMLASGNLNEAQQAKEVILEE